MKAIYIILLILIASPAALSQRDNTSAQNEFRRVNSEHQDNMNRLDACLRELGDNTNSTTGLVFLDSIIDYFHTDEFEQLKIDFRRLRGMPVLSPPSSQMSINRVGEVLGNIYRRKNQSWNLLVMCNQERMNIPSSVNNSSRNLTEDPNSRARNSEGRRTSRIIPE